MRRSVHCLLFSALSLTAACGGTEPGDPGGGGVDTTTTRVLHVDSITPAAGLSARAWPGIRLVFDTTLNAASISAATVSLAEGGTALSTDMTLTGSGRVLVLDGPLLPATSYTLTIGTGLRGTAGDSLAAPVVHNFTTRSLTAHDLVAPETWVRQYLTLAPDGQRHVLSLSYDGNAVRYSTCPAANDCTQVAGWQTATIDSGGSPEIGSGALTQDGLGGLHAIYRVNGASDVRYAECTAACATAASWTTITLDSAGNRGLSTAILARPAGGLAAVYNDWAESGLWYAECGASCGVAGNWSFGRLPARLPNAQDIAMSYDGDGALVVIDRGTGASTYPVQLLSCAAACTDSTSWQTGTYDTPGLPTGGAAMVTDQGGTVHLVTLGSSGEVTYATCTATCATGGSWAKTPLTLVGTPSGVGPGLAIWGKRLAIVTGTGSNVLTLATCSLACGTASHWRSAVLNATTSTGSFPRIGFTATGEPVMVTGTTGAQYVE